MLLELHQVNKSFSQKSGSFRRAKKQVLHEVSFSLQRGECLGLIGESGSGKSTIGRIILGLLGVDSGEVRFADNLAGLERVRRTSVVFQDYTSSVNPRMTVLEAISEPLRILGAGRAERRQKAEQLLAEVGLSGEYLTRLPHQLSGGQLQRVCIARAIAPDPAFILFDEAVSSLDVSIQVQTLDLIKELKERLHLSCLFITHDITAAAYICDRLLVLQQGRIVERIDRLEQLAVVKNDYTRQLLNAASYLEQSWEES